MAYDGQGYAGSLQASEHFSEFHFDAGTHSHHDSEDVAGLKNQASRLSHLLKVMPAGVIVIDGQGIVRQANDQARALLGEPLEGQIWRTIISRSFKPRADDGHEVSLIDGRRVKLSITPLENEPGQLIVLTDLTETRQLQARVSHMQRLSALGKMVASLAHQIRTPLSAAMLYAANMKRTGLGEAATMTFADKLSLRLKELESQVNDMLLFAKSGEEQVVADISIAQLKAAVEPTAATLAQQAELSLLIDDFSGDVMLKGNITALQGALLNLIHNAAQVTKKGGAITVSARESDGNLILSVADKGPGVPDSLQDKIFEPFFTTKTHGTGLGLAVVKSVASAHKGQLSVVNLPSGGACFSITLPSIRNNMQAQLTDVTGEVS